MATFIEARITATEAAIEAAETAQAALLAGGIQSYTLDTGQTISKVNKFEMDQLRKYIEGLYNRYGTLQARNGNGGQVIGVPCF